MKIDQPFHAGEIAMQEQLGERSSAVLNGRLYETVVMAPARGFIAQQRYLILGAIADDGALPITVLAGDAAFARVTAGGDNVRIQLPTSADRTMDPALRVLAPGVRVGLLAIELSSRRRLRINGRVTALADGEIVIQVDESYPNCPKYIQKRLVDDSKRAEEVQYHHAAGLGFPHAYRRIIEAADTMFVASANPAGHADASHRGGPPGFVRILPTDDLRIPDYGGNSLFNTFGNFAVNPRAGLLFWDFEHSALLHLQGTVRFDLGSVDEESARDTGGTRRWWIFTVTSWEWQQCRMPFVMSAAEFSPFLAALRAHTA
jgi:uncharacterized protein